jgi:hypothetical protein
MQISVKAGLAHVNTFMHPQAVIIDESGQEDDFFPKSIKAKAADIGVSIIGLPSNAAEKLMWITTLDSNSLKRKIGPSSFVVDEDVANNANQNGIMWVSTF